MSVPCDSLTWEPLSTRPLERQLLALDGDAFVAALWGESGWTVERDGSETSYAFDLSRTTDDSGQSCWVIDRFSPA